MMMLASILALQLSAPPKDQKECLTDILTKDHRTAWASAKWLYYYRKAKPNDHRLAIPFHVENVPNVVFRKEFLCFALRGSSEPKFVAFFKFLLAGNNYDLQLASFRALQASRNPKLQAESVTLLKKNQGFIPPAFGSIITEYRHPASSSLPKKPQN